MVYKSFTSNHSALTFVFVTVSCIWWFPADALSKSYFFKDWQAFMLHMFQNICIMEWRTEVTAIVSVQCQVSCILHLKKLLPHLLFLHFLVIQWCLIQMEMHQFVIMCHNHNSISGNLKFVAIIWVVRHLTQTDTVMTAKYINTVILQPFSRILTERLHWIAMVIDVRQMAIPMNVTGEPDSLKDCFV